MKIAFIGLGRMGSGMAHNLLLAGHEVSVFNRTAQKTNPLEAEGAHVAHSAADACREARVAITMLADDAAVEGVVFGHDGVAAGLKHGAVHMSSSTISTAMARKLVSEHEARNQRYISAPVFGRPESAEKKQLLVVAAGQEDVLKECGPLFEAIGRQTFVAGAEAWQANAVKLCGNFMIASMLETFSEAYATLRKSKVDHHRFLEIINELFNSPVYKNYGQIVADEKFDPPGFELKLGLKDVRQVIEAAQDADVAMPFASVVRDHLVSALAHGQEKLDWSSVALVLARAAGLDRQEPKSAHA